MSDKFAFGAIVKDTERFLENGRDCVMPFVEALDKSRKILSAALEEWENAPPIVLSEEEAAILREALFASENTGIRITDALQSDFLTDDRAGTEILDG